MAAQVKTELGFNMGRFAQGFRDAAGAVRKFRSDVSGALEGVKSTLGSLRTAMIGVGVAGISLKKALGVAGRFETFQAQLEVLLKDSEAARRRLEKLSEFGAKTPFELPGVTRASITLETLTKGALSAGAGLTLVGDLAAATNQPIEELAVHVGRPVRRTHEWPRGGGKPGAVAGASKNRVRKEFC